MAAVVLLTFACLVYQVNSQTVGFGPNFGNPRGCEPISPCGEVFRPTQIVTKEPCGPTQTISNLFPNLKITQQSLNVPPSCIKNQLPINQPIVNIQPPKCNCLPSPICTNPLPPCVNRPQAPSVITNPATPVVTVVEKFENSCGNPTSPCVTVIDSTLASSLANALQLLIVSNILESSVPGQTSPCFNNYEVVSTDFTTVPSINYEYFNNGVNPEVIITEPVYPCKEPAYVCQEPVFSILESVSPCVEPVAFQSYPNIGSFSLIDIINSGFQCGPNQVVFEAPNQYIAQLSPCNDQIPHFSIPAVAEIPQMALEVPFPSSIPAQLTCNVGLLPSNQPCVTFNVESLPCNNMYSNY